MTDRLAVERLLHRALAGVCETVALRLIIRPCIVIPAFGHQKSGLDKTLTGVLDHKPFAAGFGCASSDRKGR